MKININSLLTKLIILCSTVMLAFTSELGILTTRYCLFAIIALCFLKVLFLRPTKSQLVALALVFLSCTTTLALYGGNPANSMIFFSSLILAIVLHHDGMEQHDWKLLKVCTVVAAVWFAYQYLSNEYPLIMGKLCLSFSNPNMAGIALSAPCMMLVLMLTEERAKASRLFFAVLAAILLYMVYLTENRGSFFMLVVFVAAAVLITNKIIQIRFTSSVLYTALKFLPIIAMVVYVFLFSVLPADLELLGKPFFSGREYGWKIALEQLIKDPFTHHSYEEGTLNLFLEGASRYGLVSMIGYFWLLITIKKDDLKQTKPIHYLAYLGFHLCLFQQSFESTMITGSYSVYTWTYMLLGIASMKTEDPQLCCPQKAT